MLDVASIIGSNQVLTEYHNLHSYIILFCEVSCVILYRQEGLAR